MNKLLRFLTLTSIALLISAVAFGSTGTGTVIPPGNVIYNGTGGITLTGTGTVISSGTGTVFVTGTGTVLSGTGAILPCDDTFTLCEGDTITLASGIRVCAAGTYIDEINGGFYLSCVIDGVVPDGMATIAGCGSATLPSGTMVSTSGTYNDVLVGGASTGCDSTVIVTVTILTGSTGAETAAICAGGSYTLPSGTVVTLAGNYTSTLTAANGCDSIVTTTLTVNPATASSENAAICSGDTYTLPSGAVVSAAGTYTSTLTNSAGCDSVITTTLVVNNASNSTENVAICGGDTYTLPSGIIVSTAGTYTSTLTGSNGCDSIITSNVSVTPQPNAGAGSAITVCDTASPFDLNGLVVGGDAGGNWTNSLGGTVSNFVDPGTTMTDVYTYTVSNACGVNTTTVMVTITNCAGCDSLDVLIAGNAIICLDGTGTAPSDEQAILTAITGSGFTFAWTTIGGTIPAGTAQNQTIITGTPGMYVVTITDTTNGCFGRDTITVVEINCFLTGGIPKDVQGVVWTDDNLNMVSDATDNNGIYDPAAGEMPIAGVAVVLYDATTGLPIDTAYTNAAGQYCFSNVAPGDYFIGFPTIIGSAELTKQSEGDDALDPNSDPNPLTGFTSVFTVTTGINSDLNIGAGYFVPNVSIDLISFTGNANDCNVDLTWVTATEQDVNYFIIERSTDGVNYELVSNVNAAGNAITANEYTVTDVSPINGTSYYRLSEMTMNNVISVAKVISVHNNCSTVLSIGNVYPNPTVSSISLDVTSEDAGLNVELIDITGRVLNVTTIDATGFSTTTFNVSDYAKGIYFIKVSNVNGEALATEKFIKD